MNIDRSKKFIAGNWKMNHSLSDIDSFFNSVKPEENCHQWIAPQSIHVGKLLELAKGKGIEIGGQNCCDKESGAFTGEVSPNALKDLGAGFVIIGHSERRHIYGETNNTLREKVALALAQGLTVIYCIGETLEEREANKTNEVLEQQLTEGLADISSKQLLIAYEPVWAIGTGKTATPEMAQEAHAFTRKICESRLNLGDQVPILYGGSVKPANVEGLLSCSDIDGALVGGASLKADDYNALCSSAANL